MIPPTKYTSILSTVLLAAVATQAFSADSSLIAGLAQVMGEEDAQAIGSRADAFQEALQPIFASMPHNDHGKMGSPVVRYVLHRFFMQSGWSVRGLEPSGQGWSAGSPTRMLGDAVPKRAVELFDERLTGEGLDLHEVAVLAATFKNIVRTEMVRNLEAAYNANGQETVGSISEEEAHRVLGTYAAAYVLGKDISAMRDWEVHQVELRARSEYNNLPQVQRLARETMRTLVGSGNMSFSAIKLIAEELGERFGAAEDSAECRPRKEDLVGFEHRGSGRVPLSEFYRAALHEGKWHFGESTGYLRQLGALDESDPNNLQVIIPNYINSKSNCVDSSKYYSVCCLNECDALLGRLEREIGSPGARPSDIAPLVAAMASATVPGNRTLPATLLRRLEEVAEGNDGLVPLHGRLFAQWMHHAYPRECPFPHLAGTTSPLRVEDWAAEPGNQVVASHAEMREHAEAPRPQQGQQADGEADDEGECAPWMEEEEILAPHAPTAAERQAARRGSRSPILWAISAVIFLVALATGSLHLAAPRSAGGPACGRAAEKMADFTFASNV